MYHDVTEWPHRILADDAVVEIVRSYFIVPEEMSRGDPVLAKIFVEQRPEWVCWKTGLELKYMDSTLFSLKQVQVWPPDMMH